MSVIVTRMPSTGEVTNICVSAAETEVCRKSWADNPAVEVYSDEEYEALPKCSTCGCTGLERQCADCRYLFQN